MPTGICSGGEAINSGIISTPRGNVTLAALNVSNLGVLSSTTANNRPGTVNLIARDYSQNAPRTGFLRLGANSLIEIGAETGAGEVIYSPDEDFQHSRIQFFGNALDMAGSATIVAPSASMEIGRLKQPGGLFSVVKIGEGAVIDLSGRVDVAADIGRNIVAFEARLNELRDAPLQRDGLLYELARMREQIRVDIREGSALVDVSGAEGLIPYTVEQLQTIGGTLSIEAGQFFTGRDSLIAVAGGSIAYQGGVRDATTQLVGADGRIYDIGSAPADIQYVGLAGRFSVDHGRWGVTENFRTNLGRARVFESGYTEGGDAGSVTVGANGNVPLTYIDGTMDGRRIVGERQLAIPAANDGNSAITRDVPAFGQLSMSGLNLRLVAEADNFTTTGMPTLVRSTAPGAGPGFVLDGELPTVAEGGDLSITDVLENFGDITINGGVTLAAGESIDLEAGSSIDLVARDIGGSITARGGSIAISAIGQDLINPAIVEDATLVIRSTAKLSVAGEWVNNYQANLLGETAGTAAWTDAGSITLTTVGLPVGIQVAPITGTEIEQGAVLDLSGGGFVSADGVFTGGDGGDLRFATNFLIDDEGGEIDENTGLFVDRGSIITAFGVGAVDGGRSNGRGGTIAFAVGRLKVGDSGDPLSIDDGVMRVNANGWDDRGFSVVSLSTARGLPIDSDTSGSLLVDRGSVIAPITQTRVVGVDAALASATGTAVADLGSVATLDQLDRSGTSIILAADGRLDLGGVDAVLRADAGSGVTVPTISISSNDSYLVEGVIEAATGVIDISGSRIERPSFSFGSVIASTEFDPSLAVWIADTARISARGLFQSRTDANGLTLGTVRDGGTVTLTGANSYLVVEKGAVIDVSGVAGRTDLVSPVRSVPHGPLAIDSIDLAGNAGAIRINLPTTGTAIGGSLGAFIDGTLIGRAGGTGARGGTLALGISSTRLTNVEPTAATTTSSVVIRQSGTSLAEGVAFGDQIDPTLALDMVDINFDGQPDQVIRGAELTGRTFFAADTLQGSGMDAVQLGARAASGALGSFGGEGGAVQGTVTFDGDVSLDAGRVLAIYAGAVSVVRNADGSDADVTIGADYVNLLGVRAATPNVAGESQGSLTVSGDFIDNTFEMGFRNIGQTTLDSRSDIRIAGVDNVFNNGFLTAGDLTLRAQQLYPTTDTIAVIRTTAPEGTVRFERADGGIGATPLSAGAKLTVTADTIVQGGVVRAPMGSITFNPTSEIRFEDGSLTSVSLDGNIVPYGQIRSDRNPIGTEWYADDPTTTTSGGNLPPLIDTPPEKIIAINGAVIDVQAGATLDLSGSGDILAYRFVPGPGGSRDVLARLIAGTRDQTQFADGRDVYAILPGKQPFAAPKSQYISDSGTSLGSGSVAGNARNTIASYVGDSVELKGVPGIPDGTYTLLPGRYAMLPGAFRVVATPGGTAPSLERPLAGPVTLPDGTIVADGILKVNGTGLRDDRFTRLTIQPRETWTRYSAYEFAEGNEFFVDRAASLDRPVGRLARDAGQLALAATQSLQLNGTARFDRAENGRGGLVDISAERIAITAGGADYGVEGYLSLSGEQLSGLGADSLLIGGTRTALADGDFINVTAKALVVAEGASLTAPELLLVAGPGSIDVDFDGDGIVDDSNFDGIISELRPEDGLLVAAGARLAATGTSLLDPRPLQIGRAEFFNPDTFETFPAVSGDSALIRLAVGEAAPLTRANIDGALSRLTIETGSSLIGDALLLDGTGAITLGRDVSIDAETIDLGASRISLGAVDAVTDGLALDAALVAQIAAADTLVLRGRQSIDTYGDVALGRDGGASEAIRIETGMLRGFGGDLTIQARDVTMVGGAAGTDGALASGGTLTINADALTLGAGAKRIEGFGTTRLSATGTITGDGDGALATPGALDITAGQITLTSGSQLAIDVGGTLQLASSGGTVTPGEGLGGLLTIDAASIAGGAPIAVRGGNILMTARAGSIDLTGGTIDARGTAVAFGEETKLTPAGTITLTATDAVRLGAGAALDVSAVVFDSITGRDSGNAGSITIAAQSTELNGSISGTAVGDGKSGRFALISGGPVDLDPLNVTLDQGGFFGRRAVRSGSGDLVVGTNMQASEVSLVADGGSVLVTGVVGAGGAGEKGGRIVLAGRDGVMLTGRLDARALNDGRGGLIEIGSTDGALDLGGTITVGGGGGGGGRVRLRVALDDVAGSSFGSTIDGARSIELEPFVTVASDTVDAGQITDAFESVDVVAIRARTGLGEEVHITPGVEVVSAGDLTLAALSDIDLHELRTSEGDAGVLTLRAGGDLTLLSSISDGFDGASNLARPIDDESWSYRFAAGAALTSADPLATVNAVDAGDVRVSEIWTDDTPTNPQIIRTGIGSIDVAAAGDILLRDPDSVIYTAGRPVIDVNNVIGVDADGNVGTGYFYDPLAPTYVGLAQGVSPFTYYAPSWNYGGGDLRLVAGRDIAATISNSRGENVGETHSDWLWRQGAIDPATGDFLYRPALPDRENFAFIPASEEGSTQTAWWINFSKFNQNFGVLGGGDAMVSAGRDFTGSVSIPTNARVGGGVQSTYVTEYYTGEVVDNSRVIVTESGLTPRGTGTAVIDIRGGGDLLLDVGRDIRGGSQFYVAKGEGDIRAGGSILAGGVAVIDSSGLPAMAPAGSIFALGDAQVSVTAAGDISLSTFDPLSFPVGPEQGQSDAPSGVQNSLGGFATGDPFLTYGTDAALDVTTIGGDLTFLNPLNDFSVLGTRTLLGTNSFTGRTPSYEGFAFYPIPSQGSLPLIAPNLYLTAFAGDLEFPLNRNVSDPNAGVPFLMAGSPTGQLEIRVAGDIAKLNVTLPDFDLDFQASAFQPGNRFGGDAFGGIAFPPSATPIRFDDDRPAVIYAGGTIATPFLDIDKALNLATGGDLLDATIRIQHANPTSVSTIRAGRDIGTAITESEFFGTRDSAIEIAGGGRLRISAERNIYAVSSNQFNDLFGIRSIGNSLNPSLPDDGAAIDVMFGLGAIEDAGSFLRRLLDPANAADQYTTYNVELSDGSDGRRFIIDPEADRPMSAEALDAILFGLSQEDQRSLAIDLFFRELDSSGREVNQPGPRQGSYIRGNSAVEALFPGIDTDRDAPATDYSGGTFNLQNTSIRSEAGGDINVIGPGGDFLLGAISTAIDRDPGRRGVLTTGYGNINLFAFGDIQVGQSRVFSIDGGDILLWSSSKDINAGAGSKSLQFTPPLRTRIDDDANRTVDRVGLVTGSGIANFAPVTPIEEVQRLVEEPDSPAEQYAQTEEERRRTAPRVNLVAPIGEVDAGDAGIRSVGDLNIAALTVVNAANIDVGGEAFGVPEQAVVNVGLNVDSANAAASAATAATDAARENRQRDRPSVVTVEVLGFGGEFGAPEDCLETPGNPCPPR